MQYQTIIEKTLTDAGFKSQLISNPKATLAQMGLEMGSSEIRVHADSANSINFVLLTKEQAAGMDTNSVIGKITARAHADAAYKTRLLTNAQAAVQEVLGVAAPQNIQVFENTNQVLNIVLPANPSNQGELSDTDLSMVAGGKGLTINCTTMGSGVKGAAAGAVKVGGFFGADTSWNKLLTSLGPILTGTGSAIAKASDFMASFGK